MKPIGINLSDKPNLVKLREDNPEAFKAVVSTFTRLMEEAAENKWYELPKQFHPDMDFKMMIGETLHGIFDVHLMGEGNDALDMGVYLHPFYLFGGQLPDGSYADPDNKFAFDRKENVSRIASLLRKVLYYSRFIDMEKFAKACFSDSIELYTSERDLAPLLAIQPAIRYQREHMGEHVMGKLRADIGFFDCGDLSHAQEVRPTGEQQCNACSMIGSPVMTLGQYKVCTACRASFKKEE